MTEPTVDADAFNAFETAGWERQVAGYEQFFVPITAHSSPRCSTPPGSTAAPACWTSPPGPGS